MRQGQQFCIKGKIYKYSYSQSIVYKTSYPFNVVTENTPSHSMSSIFFHEYFQIYDKNILDDNLFEI